MLWLSRSKENFPEKFICGFFLSKKSGTVSHRKLKRLRHIKSKAFLKFISLTSLTSIKSIEMLIDCLRKATIIYQQRERNRFWRGRWGIEERRRGRGREWERFPIWFPYLKGHATLHGNRQYQHWFWYDHSNIIPQRSSDWNYQRISSNSILPALAKGGYYFRIGCLVILQRIFKQT